MFESSLADLLSANIRRRRPLLVKLWCAQLLAVYVAGCGGAVQTKPPALKPLPQIDFVERYSTSIRLESLAKIQQAAGFDMLAAEYFRAAYQSHPKLDYLVEYARASEQAGHYAEAHVAYKESLQHQMEEGDRQRLEAETSRLKTLVPTGLARVIVQVHPAGTRVRLSPRTGDAHHEHRMMLVDGTVYLPAGTYKMQSEATGYKDAVRSFRVNPQGQVLLAVRLRRVKSKTVAMAGFVAQKPAPQAANSPAPASPSTRGSTAKGAPESAITPASKSGAAPVSLTRSPDDKPAHDAVSDPKTVAETAIPQPRVRKQQDDATSAQDPEESTDDERDSTKAEQPTTTESDGEEPELGEEDDIDASQDEDDIEQADAAIDAAAPPASTSAGGWLHRVGPIISTSLGVAALGGAGYFGYLAQTHATYANDLNVKSPKYNQNLQEQSDLAHDNAKLANYLFIGGGVIAAAGTAWWILAPRSRLADTNRDEPNDSALANMGLCFDGQRVLARWRF